MFKNFFFKSFKVKWVNLCLMKFFLIKVVFFCKVFNLVYNLGVFFNRYE